MDQKPLAVVGSWLFQSSCVVFQVCFFKKNTVYSQRISFLVGGTDIISCFMGHNVTVPVYKGEIQARNLGMAVEAWNDEGNYDPKYCAHRENTVAR